MVGIVYSYSYVDFNLLVFSLCRVGSRMIVRRRLEIAVPALTSVGPVLSGELPPVVAKDLSWVSPA